MKSLGTVFAVGARTPLGLDSLSSAMLLRTGIPALTAAPLAQKEGDAVTMAYDLTQDPLVVGEERAGRLAKAALLEVANKIGATNARGLKLRVALAFPEPYPGQPRSEVGQILSRELRVALHETFGAPDVEVDARGSASLAYVLSDALGALARREVDAVLAGGAHSDYDPQAIRVLEATGRLFTPESLDAVIPGESAAFALIGRDDLGHRLGLPPLARITAVASESGDMTPYNDESAFEASTMTSVLRAALADLPDEIRIGWAFCDHGVEHFRVRELYTAVARLHRKFCEPMAIDSPTQRIGRTGAASLPLFLALATESFRRGYAPTPFGLLVAGSDGGERGAIVVSSP